ncbi:MAG TPA: ATP-binding protein [Actinobacteria bacterium]|nr:ATP-binding protein [Actinomycetota bacterium]
MATERYDPIANPYAPGAGTPPPALVGRGELLAGAEVALRRLRAARTAQHLLVTGLRGVGKTVLLAKLAALGEHHAFRVLRVEATGGDDTIAGLLRQAGRLVEDLGGRGGVRRALRAIESVSLTVAGTGASVSRRVSDPARDALADVVVDVAAVAADAELGVVLTLDEAQRLDRRDLRRILAGIHRAGQDALPIYAVVAGTPDLLGGVARAATYAERLFEVASLGPLSVDEVAEAVAQPAAELGVSWAPQAVERIVERSSGYPFFVQTWAYHTWNAAVDDPISAADVDRAAPHVEAALDASFFAVRMARIPPSRLAYVRALASLGPGPHPSGEVAAAMGKTTRQVGSIRNRLVADGIVYSPRHGWVEFAVPHLDRYVSRAFP